MLMIQICNHGFLWHCVVGYERGDTLSLEQSNPIMRVPSLCPHSNALKLTGDTNVP